MSLPSKRKSTPNWEPANKLRKVCFTQITNLVADAEENGDTWSQIQISIQLSILESYLERFEKCQTSIEEFDDNEIVSRTRFMGMYTQAKEKLLTFQSRFTSADSSSSNNSCLPSCSGSRTRSIIPTVPLPKFDGTYSKWTEFINTFDVYINSDATFSSVEKFQLLKNSLSGAAAVVINSLECNEENYLKALEMLKTRFENKRLIFNAHLSRLTNLTSIHKGTTVSHLRHLVDSCNGEIRALQSLGNKEQIADAILINEISSKLDSVTRSKWEEAQGSSEIPSWEKFIDFLTKRCQTLEYIQGPVQSTSNSDHHHFQKREPQRKIHSNVSTKQKTLYCPICKSLHPIFKCPSYLKLPVQDRYLSIKRLRLCINCLKPNHVVKDCPSSLCIICSRRHHTTLHFGDSSFSDVEVKGDAPKDKPCEKLVSHLSASGFSKEVILATAVVEIVSDSGSSVMCRALLDSGSQSNFITENARQMLSLPKISSNSIIVGVSCSKNNANFKTSFTLRSADSKFVEPMEALVLSQITSIQPSFPINISSWNIPKNIILADPGFSQPSRIDILLGAEMFFKFLCVGQISLGKGLPSLQKTVFGWIVSGTIKASKRLNDAPTVSVTSNIEEKNDDDNIRDLLKRFWEIEDISNQHSLLNKNEKICEEFFQNTTSRDASGRFIVRLPFESNPSLLGESFKNASCRFANLKKKLVKDVSLKNDYENFMLEYLKLGHMEQIDFPKNSDHYFMPHHGIQQLSAGKRKLRVVFDASCKTSSGKSLNNLLLKGPNILNDIFSVLCRFSFHRYVLTVDVVKMYRQILVHEEDSMYQLILWHGENFEDTRIFKLNTVTYGTASAPFLAMRCLKQLAIENTEELPLASKALVNDLYVDDILTGTNSIEELVVLKKQLTQIMSKAQMDLHKWCSNANVIFNEDFEQGSKKPILDSESPVTKTLGMNWLPSSDQFYFELGSNLSRKVFTKRTVLSVIASLYDPLGLIAPIIVTYKIFMQSLWKRNFHWDESLPLDLHTEWETYLNHLQYLKELKFSRLSVLPNANVVEFHGFSDASERAYGACIFVKSMDSDRNVRINLLCAKSRVAPVKTLSIPRLELCGALLLSELMSKVMSSLPINVTKTYCWTDSSIVLSWLQSHPSNWSTFVSHRVAKIQTLSETHCCNWNHIRSGMNPADILSRGASPTQLKQSKTWFSGPEFLKLPEIYWPVAPALSEVELERKRTVLLYSQSVSDIVTTSKYLDKYKTLRRVFAYVHIFINNIKARLNKTSNFVLLNRTSLELSPQDIIAGETLIIRVVQYSAYEFEIDALTNNKLIDKKSNLLRLSPFIDHNKILRVGGRLHNSCLDSDAKHQILLPKTHIFTKKLVSFLHRSNMHAGTETLLSILRQKYWIPSSRQFLRSIIHSCLICFRSKPIVAQQIMGNLPAGRVQQSLPFLHVGVDYCGPFLLKQFTRGKIRLKAYVAVFICFSTKAVHMELVSNLSAEAFIAALHRFISRRGKPASITSDNATNFIGAKRQINELKDLFTNQQQSNNIKRFCVDEGIEWKFIPPRAPHFGGLWEASVKKAKYHLTRVLQNNILNHEEYCTILSRIEAVINSRPLTPISTDPHDLEALTPAHFLIGRQLTAITEPDTTETKLSHLSRWQLLSRLQQHFWKRWKNEYLSTLQERNKWMQPSPNLTENTMVLLKDENRPTPHWPLGRVEKLYKGDDGKIRVVDVRTASGIFKRAIHKVCVLPIEKESSFEVPSRPGEC